MRAFQVWAVLIAAAVQLAARITQDGGNIVLSYADEISHASVEIPQPWHSTFLAAYGLRIGGERYLFVAWPPDTQLYEGGVCTATRFMPCGARASKRSRAAITIATIEEGMLAPHPLIVEQRL